MKELLNNLCKKYETPEFIEKDPVFFPHQYKEKRDIEIAAFIAALYAYGKREAFIKKLKGLFELSNSPYELIKDYKNFDLKPFNYRFFEQKHVYELLKILHKLYFIDNLTIEELFYNSKDKFNGIQGVIDYFYKYSDCPDTLGFNFMFVKPENNSAMKRWNMFLRWMVRGGCVDFGLWDFIKTSDLIIPLDTHVAQTARKLNLLSKASNDIKAACQLTEKLKEFDENDPVKYDFALFGYGIDKN